MKEGDKIRHKRFGWIGHVWMTYGEGMVAVDVGEDRVRPADRVEEWEVIEEL